MQSILYGLFAEKYIRVGNHVEVAARHSPETHVLPAEMEQTSTAEKQLEQTGTAEKQIHIHLTGWRLHVLTMANAFFTGFPFYVSIINLPQRFQAVDGTSPTGAGLRLLALLLCTPLASCLSGVMNKKLGISHTNLLILAGVLQTIGVALMSTVPPSQHAVRPTEYVFEALMGLGFGFSLSTLLLMTPHVVKSKDIGEYRFPRSPRYQVIDFSAAVANGAITQIRVLGGIIGLSTCSTVLISRIKSGLATTLSSGQLTNLLQSTQTIKALPPHLQDSVKSMYASAYAEQMRIMIGLSAAVVVASLMTWEKKTGTV
ncbi:MAG: hypothetical protein Q9187_004755 [Circinaria calcarea]